MSTPDGNAPNPVVGLFVGALFGAVVGLAVAVWEATVLAYMGLRLPAPALGQQLVVVYVAAGCGVGALGGMMRLAGSRWAMFVMTTPLLWVITGALAVEVERSGANPMTAVAVGVPIGIAVAWAIARFIPSEQLLTGLAGTLFVLLAIGAPFNLHLLNRSLVGAGALVNLAVVLVASSVGSAMAYALGDGRGVKVPFAAALAAAGGGMLVWPSLTAPQEAWPRAVYDNHPPMVMVVVGGLRADHVAATGGSMNAMPLLARRGRRGWVYSDATTTAPWTLPAMSSIFTGRVPSRHGAGINNGNASVRTGLPADLPTIPDRLALGGYASAAVVTSDWLTQAYGFGNGFGAYSDEAGPATLPSLLLPVWALGIEPYGWQRTRDAETTTDEALSFVLEQEHRSWFLFVYYADAVEGLLTEEDRVEAGLTKFPERSDEYRAVLGKVDRHLDRLLSALPADAWVFVVGDHGVELDEGRAYSDDLPKDTWYGHSMYQELLHVPILVFGPRPGRGVVSRPVSVVDLLPTMTRIAGIPFDAEIEGRPLVEIVGGTDDPDRILHAEAVLHGSEQQAARLGSYKLIRRPNGRLILYNLENDPAESQPLIWSDGDNQVWQSKLKASLPHVGAARMGRQSPTLAQELGELADRLGTVPQ